MRVVGRQVLDVFCRNHAETRGWIENWLAEAEDADWKMPADIRRQYASASFLAGNVVIFNVKGNAFRLEASVAYRVGVVTIIWAGSHTAYDARNRKRRRRS